MLLRKVLLDLNARAERARAFELSLPALLLSALVLVPFLAKPFTMDDTVFLLESRHSLTDPLHPTAFDMTWDHFPERVSRIVPTGPVMAWLLVPSVLAGGDERAAHAVQLAMLWLAVVATVSLALRLGVDPAWAGASGLLLASMPAVLGMAGTAMPDVPAMALGVAGLERLVAWRDEGRPVQGIAAAALLALSAHARMHCAALLGIGALLARKRAAPVAAAAVLIAALGALTADPASGGGSVLAAAARYASVARLASNTAAFAIHWVFAAAFAIPWLVLRRRKLVRPGATLALSTAAGAALLLLAHGPEAPLRLAPVAGLGAAALADVLLDARRRRDRTQGVLGLWLFLPLAAAAYVHLPAKLLLACAPASAILLAREMAARPGAGRTALAATVACGAGLGVAILRADAAFSGLGRTAAAELIAPEVAAGRRVWFVGHWGFQWYAQKAGGRYLTSTRPYPEPGDRVVSSRNSVPGMDPGRISAFVRRGRLEDRAPGGRIMSREAGAGFYANTWGYLPWAWGDDVVDAFELFDVTGGRASNTRSRP